MLENRDFRLKEVSCVFGQKLVVINHLRNGRTDPCCFSDHSTIGSYVSVRSSRYEARGKFGEHER